MAIPEHIVPWMTQLVASLPSVPESVIKSTFKQVVLDFSRDSMVWVDTLDPHDVVAGDPDVWVTHLSSRSVCLFVLQVYLEGQELAHATHARPGQPPASRPVAFTCSRAPDIITLLPTPTVDIPNSLVVRAALQPRNPLLWMPPFFLTHYFNAILDGTLARFYLQPLKPYTDKELGRQHERKYRAAIQEAADISRRGNSQSAQGWAFPRFGV